MTGIRGDQLEYRVWIIALEESRPPPREDVQSRGIALEPAEAGTMTLAQARRYVETFNQTARERHRPVRAVAAAVAIRYEGDPKPGQSLPLVPSTQPQRHASPG